ncbi:GcrA family cell cycle regulator [Methanobrevibacter sp.]|uniref:GcrA family cell cycle regulator n=1 Tax=Methanobrevibacter sp. TaxID=66852 RepID=UPI003890227F
MIKNRGDKWTTEEINLAKELYEKGVIISNIAPRVNHSENAVTKKLKDLKLTGNRRVLWTDKDLDKLRDLFNQGLPYSEIAKKLEKTTRACQGKAIRLGLRTKECNVWINNKRADFWTDSEIETLKKSIADGLFMPDILKIINRSEKCIFNKMHELDLHFRERSEAEKAIYKRVYSVDDDYFENIDSQKKAYWLGWLVTDGYVISVLNTKRGLIKSNKIGLKLVYSDENVILDFNKDLKSTFPIEYLKEKSNLILRNNNLEEIKSKKQVCLELTSAKMIQDLAKYGIHQNKTYDVVFPKELDSKYYPGFIAGVISGDGCINVKLNHGKTYILRCLIAGTFDLIDNIKNILVKEIGVNPDKKITKNKGSKCLYTLELNQTETIALYNWLQKNGISLMERKNKLIEEFLNERVKIPA